MSQAPDEVLRNLGLVKTGDILSLRGFCEAQMREQSNSERKGAQEETKRKLLVELYNQKRKKPKKVQDGYGGNRNENENQAQKKVKTRRIQIGWLHFDEHGGKYVSMRLNRGGGTREVDVPLNADVYEIMQTAQDIFFPDGRCDFGTISDMELDLANFKSERMQRFTSDGKPFTLQHYIDACKATRIRLYIQTKKRNSGEKVGYQEKQAAHEEGDEDDHLLIPAFQNQEMQPEGGRLVGLSRDREELKRLQDEELFESMAIDQAADETRRCQILNEIERAGRQLRLRQARGARVEPEPEPLEPKIVVSVRHLVLGVVSRPFHLNSYMSAVYDWVGSLSMAPEHFRLCAFDGKALLPSESVQVAERTMLYMAETDDGPDLSEDPEINFLGFGSGEPKLDDTLPTSSSILQPSTSFAVSPISGRPPEKLLEDDEDTE